MKDLKQKPGMPPVHRLAIYDHKGNMRGHVGRTATAATVARFLGRHGAQLGKKDGRDAWIGDTPPPPPPSDFIMGPKGSMLNPKAVGRGTEQVPPEHDPKMIALNHKIASDKAKVSKGK